MGQPIDISGPDFVGGGYNDTSRPDRRAPNQYQAVNCRVLPDYTIEKLKGREYVLQGLGSTVKDILCPERRKSLATLTEDNNRLSFIYDGVEYTAVLTEGKYYSRSELATELAAALNAAVGSTAFAVSSARTYTAPASAKTGKISYSKQTLHEDVTDVATTVKVRYGANYSIADWKTSGLGKIRIGSEEITYTTATDQTTYVELTGVTRGVNGTTKAAHTLGDKVTMHYSAASTAFRDEYLFIGSSPDNRLDADADGVDDTPGYTVAAGS